MSESFDDLVRRVDEDRWLASRFAPKRAQAYLIALYALNYEIARTPETVSTPALGDIKLAWWAEAVDEIYAGKAVRKHPALQAYAGAVAECGLPRAPLDALIAARAKDLDPAPFETWDDLDFYLDATAGNVLRLAIVCVSADAQPAQVDSFISIAGRAWGYCGLLRASAFWRARGRSFMPKATKQQGEGALLESGGSFYEQARKHARSMSSELFPAFGYLAFCKSYFAKLESGENAQTPLLMRQLGLVWSAATGKV